MDPFGMMTALSFFLNNLATNFNLRVVLINPLRPDFFFKFPVADLAMDFGLELSRIRTKDITIHIYYP